MHILFLTPHFPEPWLFSTVICHVYLKEGTVLTCRVVELDAGEGLEREEVITAAARAARHERAKAWRRMDYARKQAAKRANK